MDSEVKDVPHGGGGILSDVRSVFSVVVKAGRTMTAAYGIIFAFVALSLCLAFTTSSTSSSSSPWFSNFFSLPAASDSAPGSYSFRFQFPKGSSPESESLSFAPPVGEPGFSRSGDAKSLAPPPENAESLVKDRDDASRAPSSAHSEPVSAKGSSQPPRTDKSGPVAKNSSSWPPSEIPDEGDPLIPPTRQSAVTEKQPSAAENSTQIHQNSDAKLNQTAALVVEDSPASANQSRVSGFPSTPSNDSTSSPPVNDSKGSEPLEKWAEALMKCDFFDGDWVADESYPLYKPGSCSLIDGQFNCFANGRPDKDFQKFRWKPRGCTLPRLNGSHMLEMLRGKRLAFVGDSLNRNMWESLVCILKGSVKNQSNVFEARGRRIFRGDVEYSFVFKDYNCTVELFVSPFLVREWSNVDKNRKKKTLRLDLMDRTSEGYSGADIIIFNTGHWWNHEKTSKGKNYYQEGSHVHSKLDVLEAFRKAITTWGRWVDANVDPAKTLVFFKGYSIAHFRGGKWNAGGVCDNETRPIRDEEKLAPYPPLMQMLERVLKGMQTPVSYLNITRLTDYRKDGHPSKYRSRNRVSRIQDCSHWCLPGVPDLWNEILYAQLLLKLGHLGQNSQIKQTSP